MLKKKGHHQKVDSRDIRLPFPPSFLFFSFLFFSSFVTLLFSSHSMFEAHDVHGSEFGAPPSAAPSPLVSLASSFASATSRTHRRVHSDAQSPSMERRSRGGSPDEEVDPFKHKRKKHPNLRMGGSFRGKKLLSPDESTMSSPSEDVTPATRKKLINKLLSRARSSTREKSVHVSTDVTSSDWVDSEDSSSESGGLSRHLERQNSVVIHEVDEKPTRPSGRTPVVPRLPAKTGPLSASEPDLSSQLSLSGRMRGGAMMVKDTPPNVISSIEATMSRILEQLEQCSVPLKELEGMRLEEEQAHQEAQAQLNMLNEQLTRIKARSNLGEYEETLKELSASDLMPRFRFGPDQLLNIDDHLAIMEEKVLASIQSEKRSSYMNTMLVAVLLGLILAWMF